MFERFTAEARAAVVGAQVHARALHHGNLGAEHLLLGVAEQPAGARLLQRLGVDPAGLRHEMASRGEADGFDEDALAAMGIDLDAIRARVEERFGPGALDRPPGRGRCRRGASGRHMPFTPQAKKVLEISLREATALGDRHIGAEHLLLALAREHALPGADRAAVLAVLRRAA
jgi:ATP-dependent Clp protease ATP-binding subunit ClpA